MPGHVRLFFCKAIADRSPELADLKMTAVPDGFRLRCRQICEVRTTGETGQRTAMLPGMLCMKRSVSLPLFCGGIAGLKEI